MSKAAAVVILLAARAVVGVYVFMGAKMRDEVTLPPSLPSQPTLPVPASLPRQ